MDNGQGENNKLNLTSEQCGPDCDCVKPTGNKKMKVAVSLLVVLAACGIIAYKMTSAKAGAPASKNAAFTTNGQPSGNATAQGNGAGEALDSLKSLNEKAADKDAVFIIVPPPVIGAITKKETVEAINAVMRDLKSKQINAGMYTLKPGTPDYAKLTTKPTPPVVMVISKGGSAVMVAGVLTDTELMQAYVASTRSGGCGSGSSCGDSSKCK